MEGAGHIGGNRHAFGTNNRHQQSSAQQADSAKPPVRRHEEAQAQANQRLPQLPHIALESRHGSKKSLGVIESLGFIQPKPRKTFTLKTESFGEFKLDHQILPEKLQDVSGDILKGLLREISAKIEAGGLLYHKIIVGEKTTSDIPSQKDISDLMWFLQAEAERQAGTFTSGALSLEDPHLYLTDYLKRSDEAYKRPSSHIKEFQAVTGGEHYGVDFNPQESGLEGYSKDYGQYLRLNSEAQNPNADSKYRTYWENVLPHDKGSVMIAPMLTESGIIKENRVLLKMEPYGCAWDPFGLAENRNLKRNNQYDFKHTIGHGWEYFLSLLRKLTGSQHQVGTRRERVPEDIKNAYKKLINLLNDEDRKQNNRSYGNPLSDSGGIRAMHSNAKYILQNSKLETNDVTKFENFCNMIERRYPKQTLKHRIGNEVILTPEELAPTA